jgi:hypothetical protein
LDRPTTAKRSPARLKKLAKFKSTSDLKSHSPTSVKRSPARLKKPAKFKSTSDLKSHSPIAIKRSPARLKKPAKFKSTSDLKSHSSPLEVDFASISKPIPFPEYSTEAAMSGTDDDPPRYFTMNPDWDSSQDDNTLFLLLLATGQGSHLQQTETKPHPKRQRKRTFFFPQPSSRSIDTSFLDL